MNTILKVLFLSIILHLVLSNSVRAENNVFSSENTTSLNYQSENLYMDTTSYSELLKAAINTVQFENFDLAEKYLSLAVRLKPKEDKAWQILSVVYIEKKMYRNAYLCAKNAYEINPNSSINKFNYGQFLKKQETENFYYDAASKTMIINSIKNRDILEEAMQEEYIKDVVSKITNKNNFELTKFSKTLLLARIKRNNL